jgi:hypothetical protein
LKAKKAFAPPIAKTSSKLTKSHKTGRVNCKASAAAKNQPRLLTLRVDQSTSYRVLYVPFSSPLLKTDTFLIDRKEVMK